jgi:hypothetical protein
LLSSIARRRFTSRDRICFQAWPSQGMFNEELPTEEELIAMND